MGKKDKLYTVNKWNRSSFGPKGNLFLLGGGSNQQQFFSHQGGGIYGDNNLNTSGLIGIQSSSPSIGISSTFQVPNSINTEMTDVVAQATQDAGKAKNVSAKALSEGKSGNGAGWAVAGAVGSQGIDMLGNAVNNTKYGKKTTTGGTILSKAGDMAISTGNPYAIAGGLVAKGVGLVLDGGLGSTFNEEGIKNIENMNAQTRQQANAMGQATSTDALLESYGNVNMGSSFDKDYIGDEGWWVNDVTDKYNDLRRQQNAARMYANHAAMTGAENVDKIQDSNIMRRFAAFGGPIGVMPQPTPLDTIGSAAVNYDFMSDYLTTKRKQADNKNSTSNVFASMPNKAFAFGGDMQTNSSDFLTGLTHIDAGLSHELNPNQGVQMGVDQEGIPNLVEEGETIFDDYVYSNRILCDEITKKKFHLPKKKDITYAELSKKLEKEIAERPNDPLSKAGFKAQMEDLAEQQERQKQEMEAARAREAFEALTPEEQTAVMQQIAQQEAARENLAAQAEPTGETVGTVAEQPMMAEGGHLFVKGGDSRRIYAPGEYDDNEDTLIEPVSVGTEEDGTLSVVGRKKPVPVEITNTLSPLEFMTMMRQENDRAKVNEYLDEVIDKLRKDKSSKGQIHYYPEGGELRDALFKIIGVKDIPEYISWLKENNGKYHLYGSDMTDPDYDWDSYPWEESIYNLYQQPSIRELASDGDWDNLLKQAWNRMYDSYIPSMQHVLDSYGVNSLDTYYKTPFDLLLNTTDLYDTWKEKPEWKDYTVRQLLNQSIFDSEKYVDLGRSIYDNSFGDVRFSDITPQQWKSIYDSYMDDYNKFTASYPNIPYGRRNDDVFKGRWDNSYKDYKTEIEDSIAEQQADNEEAANWQRQPIEQRRKREGKAPDTVAEQADNDEVSYPVNRPDENYTSIKRDKNGLTDFDNSTFSIPEFGITVKRPTEPTIKSAKERGVVNQPDTQASTVNSERRANPVDSIGINPSYGEMHRKGVISNPITASIQRDPDTAVSAVAPIELTHPSTSVSPVEETIPAHRAGWLRYAGLFGPAAGLGMMAAGIGKPDYSGLDAAVEQANKAPVLAQWKPIGNYLSYRPMDIWYAQNRMDANARATDRAIANSASPAKIAGLLANGYNSQLGAGELFRQALDYNNNLRERAATFNRGTDQYNSQAYNQNQQFNANALNQNTQFGAQMRMNAAQQKMDADAGWYNSLYGNVSGLFKGIGDLGRENEQYNWLSDLAADGYFGQLGTSNTSKRHLKTGRAKGGKIRRKRGLTY